MDIDNLLAAVAAAGVPSKVSLSSMKATGGPHRRVRATLAIFLVLQRRAFGL